MANVTAEQLLAKVRAQAGAIAQLELVNEALAAENAELAARLEAHQEFVDAAAIKEIAAGIGRNGKKPAPVAD